MKALPPLAVLLLAGLLPGRLLAQTAPRTPIPFGDTAVPLQSTEAPKPVHNDPLAIAAAGPTLAAVRAAGRLTCGVSRAELDYSKTGTHGPILAFAQAACRAVAAAIFGDPTRADFLGVPEDAAGLAALQAGRIALFIGATPDISNEVTYGVAFAPAILHDGQGFLVRRASIHSLADLNGKPVCFISETEMEALLPRLRRTVPRFGQFPFEEMGEMEAALSAGRCGAITADLTWLADARTGFHGQIPDFALLPDTLSNDPIAPAFRQGDPQWAQIVTWTLNALTLAEENGVTRANVDTIDDHGDIELKRLLGRTDGLGRRLGLTDAFARNAIRAVGNYGELFEATVGANSPLKLPRGEDRLVSQGGARQALPMR